MSAVQYVLKVALRNSEDPSAAFARSNCFEPIWIGRIVPGSHLQMLKVWSSIAR